MDPIERMRRWTERERIFRGVSHLVVAVSGGPDSVAALLTLNALREQHAFSLAVAHFDHQLRPDSGDDLAFVRDLCEQLGVKCLTGEGDVASAAAEGGRGIEETARLLRYQFLAFAAERERAEAVATGHTTDDQAETVLQRIVRGSGVRGIRGMLPESPLPGAPAIRLVRPLLPLTRSDTVAICEAEGVVPREDPTNATLGPLRNRIRHEVLPGLRALNPSVDEALIGLAESARELFTDVERAADLAQPEDRGFGGSVFALDDLRALPNEALSLVVEREAAFLKLEVEVNRTQLRNLGDVIAAGEGAVALGEVEAEASSGSLRVGRPAEPVEPFDPVVLNVPGATLAGGWRIEVATAPFPAGDGVPVAADGRDGALRARPLEPGDRIVRNGIERKVSTALKNERIPLWRRRTLVAIAGRARVAAVLGEGVAIGADAGASDDALYVRAVSVAPSAAPGIVLPDSGA